MFVIVIVLIGGVVVWLNSRFQLEQVTMKKQNEQRGVEKMIIKLDHYQNQSASLRDLAY